jgi:hypothetical protein
MSQSRVQAALLYLTAMVFAIVLGSPQQASAVERPGKYIELKGGFGCDCRNSNDTCTCIT